MSRWLSFLLCLVMAAVVGLQYYQMKSNQQFRRDVALELASIKTQLEQTQTEHNQLKGDLARLQKNDLGVIVEDAGKALITGWNSMLDALEKELHKAERKLQERSGKTGPEENNAGDEENAGG